MDHSRSEGVPRVAPFEPSWVEHYARARRRRRDKGPNRRRELARRRRPINSDKLLLGTILGLSAVGMIVALLAGS